MNICEQIDDKILLFFTKISHKFQRLTGRTNFFLAKCCISVLAIGLLLHAANYWFPLLSHETSLFSFFFQIFVVIIISLDVNRLDKAEKESFYSEVAQKRYFVFGEHYYKWRLLVVALALFSLFCIYLIAIGILPAKTSKFFEIICEFAFWPMLTCYDYLTIIMPLPPGKSKIREWIENFTNIFQEPAAVESKN